MSYEKAMRVLSKLKEVKVLTTVSKPSRDASTVYNAAVRVVEGLRFAQNSKGLVQVREPRGPKWGRNGRSDGEGELLSRKAAIRRFGPIFVDEEERMRRLCDRLAPHPLETPDGDTLYVMRRIFNDGRIDRGGRLYGDWQSLKEADRLKLKIDGSPVCEIDLKASFLFICHATQGIFLQEIDPYQRIDFVAADPSKRKLAKGLVNAIISSGGPLNRFPEGFRRDFGLTRRDRLGAYQEAILEAFPILEGPTAGGLEIMYTESQIIVATLEELLRRGIPSYPVHDCVICRVGDYAEAVTVLQEQMVSRLGCAAALETNFEDGNRRDCPSIEGLL